MPERDLYVDEQTSLTSLLKTLSESEPVALDTEFVREKTYYPQLCLIQIAAGDSIACVDCLADIDLGALYESLLRDECTWIVHSSRQDLEVITKTADGLETRKISLVNLSPMTGEVHEQE